jgi:hypothetical protein
MANLSQELSAWNGLAQTLIALVGAVVVWYQYREYQKARRADLAITLVCQLDTDDLIAFAVSSLDWGAGYVLVPATWRDLVEDRKPIYAAANIEDALTPKLTLATSKDPLRILYRRSFVRLFDHLQIVALHVKRDPKLLDKLEPMADLAHRLCRPLYVQTKEQQKSRPLYRHAIAEWYPGGEVLAFVEALDRRFPETPASPL